MNFPHNPPPAEDDQSTCSPENERMVQDLRFLQENVLPPDFVLGLTGGTGWSVERCHQPLYSLALPEEEIARRLLGADWEHRVLRHIQSILGSDAAIPTPLCPVALLNYIAGWWDVHRHELSTIESPEAALSYSLHVLERIPEQERELARPHIEELSSRGQRAVMLGADIPALNFPLHALGAAHRNVGHVHLLALPFMQIRMLACVFPPHWDDARRLEAISALSFHDMYNILQHWALESSTDTRSTMAEDNHSTPGEDQK